MVNVNQYIQIFYNINSNIKKLSSTIENIIELIE